jgi:predicted dinucleotide-binding enzyme
MKIGIIGAGQIGGTLTRRLTALGHKVFARFAGIFAGSNAGRTVSAAG